MKTQNTIPLRVAESYAKFPPFDKLPQATLHELANQTRVVYVQEEEIIFEENNAANPYFYFVHKGHIRLQRNQEDQRLYDVADEGDTFGIAALMRDEHYALTAIAQEESLLYEIPWQFFRKILEQEALVALHFASGFAAGYHKDIVQAKVLQGSEKSLQKGLFQEDDIVEIKNKRKLITASPKQTIQEVALSMTAHNIGSMIMVDENQLPLGIVTDTDLRKKIATGEHKVDQEIASIMTSPVLTVPEGLTVAQAIIKIMKYNIRHLVITEDGSNSSKAISVISEHDLLLLHSNNPIVLIKEIMQTKEISEMGKIRGRAEDIMHQYLEQNISMVFLSEIISELNDAIIEKCIQMAKEQVVEENLVEKEVFEHPFAWLSLGSEGRGEQLLLSDQDNALVFADASTEQENEKLQASFKIFAAKVNDLLNQVGFEFCPAEIMARKWCLSLSQWKNTFSGYLRTPEPQAVMHSTIFFDFRIVYGDRSLERKLKKHIIRTLKKERSFLNFMAINALQNPPPLSFFKNFVVEKGGQHSNEFDIKARALMPLTDAARVLALESFCLEHSNTQMRYQRIAKLEPNLKELISQARFAHELLLRHRTISGLANRDSGRYIDIDKLSKIEKQTLRSVFDVIDRIQKMLSLRFQVEKT